MGGGGGIFTLSESLSSPKEFAMHMYLWQKHATFM